MRNKIIIGMALAVLIIGHAIWGSHLSTFADNRDKVVTILCNHRLGSGAYVSPNGNVLTCAHLFRHGGSDLILVKSRAGTISKAALVRLDVKHDLAVLQTFPIGKVPYFKLGRPVYVGQHVIAFGSPLAIEGVMSQGYVENIDVGEEFYTVHGANISPGNSGGPLVDDNGRLVGVNVSMWMISETMIAQGLNNAVNLKFIKRILED